MFNIMKVIDTQQNRYSKFEVTPKSGGGLLDTYKFLIRAEIDRQYKMCLIFEYNMQKKIFEGNVKQFSGIDSIFLETKGESQPILVLLEDKHTLLINDLNPKNELGLP